MPAEERLTFRNYAWERIKRQRRSPDLNYSFPCHCAERRKPVLERNWRVHLHPGKHVYRDGDYAMVQCLSCGAAGRTKAKYVGQLWRAGK